MAGKDEEKKKKMLAKIAKNQAEKDRISKNLDDRHEASAARTKAQQARLANFTKTYTAIKEGYKNNKEKVDSTLQDHQKVLSKLRMAMAETRASA